MTPRDDARRHLEPVDDDGTATAPPADIAAERYVIGAAMLDPTQLDTCRRLLTASDFYQPANETIWRALLTQRAAGKPTEAPAIAAHLVDTKQITQVGGAPYLYECVHSASTPATATFYAERVDQLARRRRAITELLQGLNRLRAPGDNTDIDQVLVDAHTALADATERLIDADPVNTWAPVDLTAVLAGEHLDPPPTMLRRTDGTPLFYAGAVHTVSGEPESGKTWVCLVAILQLLQAGENAVLVDFEDRAERVVARLLALGARPDQIYDHFRYVRPDRALDTDGRNGLLEAIAKASLVVLDGVTEAMTLHGYDLNSNSDAATFYSLLPRWLADYGPGVVLIDHVVKDAEKQGRFGLGAQHKLAGIDGAAYQVKAIQPFGRGKRGIARINLAKDRPGWVREQARGATIGEFTLDATAGDVVLKADLTPPGDVTGRDGDGWEPTHLMEKISRTVQTTPGLSKKAIEDLVNGKTGSKRLALEMLVARGYVGTKQEARGRISHFHVKPYYADGDDEEDTGPVSETQQGVLS